MGIKKHKIISIQKWANHFGVSRPTVYSYLDEYRKQGGNYDPTDINSVLTFYRYLILKQFIDTNLVASIQPR
jgi:hypothetical protein